MLSRKRSRPIVVMGKNYRWMVGAWQVVIELPDGSTKLACKIDLKPRQVLDSEGKAQEVYMPADVAQYITNHLQ